MLGTVLLIVLIMLLLGVFPAWPHSRGWEYGPSGVIGVILLYSIDSSSARQNIMSL